jgi:hypothetical protein
VAGRASGVLLREQRSLLACLDLLDRLPEHGGKSYRGRVGAVVQELAFDAVGVRWPARRFRQAVTAFVDALRTGRFCAGMREARGFVDSRTW